MPRIDLLFPVLGSRLPTDHGYPLYSALSRILPRLHDGTLPFGLMPISGQYAGRGLLSLNVRDSRLRLRVDTDDIPALLPLAGKALEVLGHRLRLGTPHLEALEAASSLVAYMVLFNEDSTEPDGTQRPEASLLHYGSDLHLSLDQVLNAFTALLKR